MKKIAQKPTYFNRELSWLDFNNRVLQCAQNRSVPLLERLKFLSITGSNLDEFFMVRVGGLQQIVKKELTKKDPAGLRPREQLAAIGERYRQMMTDQYACLFAIEKELATAGIHRCKPQELTDEQSRHAETFFESELLPLLSPMSMSSYPQTPLLINRMLYVCVRLSALSTIKDKKTTISRIVVIPIGKSTGRFITLPSTTSGGYSFLLVEDCVTMFAHRFFPKETVEECACFRITRNADMSVQEDGAHDLLAEMEAVVDARKRGDCVRLEIDSSAGAAMVASLSSLLSISNAELSRVPGPIDLASFMRLTDRAGFEKLRYKTWPPRHPPFIKNAASMRDLIAKRDILLFHPYDSFDPVVRFIEEACSDPQVVAIKQILYRTSKNSPIVSSLMRAAEAGKYVTAVVELKARFDEERNMEWAKELEDAGVQVIYGVKGLKTHAKVCLVIRKEAHGLKRYAHFGTGNYNEITAGIYSDVSYLTCNEDLCADASAFFNSITGNSQPQKYRRLEAAPQTLKERIIELIVAETERSRQGQRAFIRAKMNSLTHPEIIDALYAASQAGVKIQLNIRGICCLKPGVKKQSETITVKSIVGRFLEHARIFHFANGGKDITVICTADWMQRNLDKRVELFVPVDDPDARNRLIHILDTCFNDTKNSWQLTKDGDWKTMTGMKQETDCHSIFYAESCEKAENIKRLKRTTFEAYKPKTK